MMADEKFDVEFLEDRAIDLCNGFHISADAPEGTMVDLKPKEVALVSIAISLKRIADALTYQESAPENLFDHIRATRYATEGMENRRG